MILSENIIELKFNEKLQELEQILEKYEGDPETLSRLIDLKNNFIKTHKLQMEMYRLVSGEDDDGDDDDFE